MEMLTKKQTKQNKIYENNKYIEICVYIICIYIYTNIKVHKRMEMYVEKYLCENIKSMKSI